MNAQSMVRGERAHQHRWQMQVHLDGCHWHRTAYACVDCGAAFLVQHERDRREDSYSMVWMGEPSYNEDGTVADQCERCQELIGGAEPKPPYSEYTPSRLVGV